MRAGQKQCWGEAPCGFGATFFMKGLIFIPATNVYYVIIGLNVRIRFTLGSRDSCSHLGAASTSFSAYI